MKNKFLTFLVPFLILVIGVWAFFYFEASLYLRILVLFLGAIGVLEIRKIPEILLLINTYLVVYDLYNIRYGLAVPLSVIMLVVLVLVMASFYLNFQQNEKTKIQKKELLYLYLVVIAFVILEIFLALSYWPVDPKTRALTITVFFYGILKTVYLHVNNMLSLKRISGFLIAGILVLVIAFTISYFLGF